jgi:hypothetical protein
MTVKRMSASSSSILDVLERVLDRGIVIDAWVGVSVAGIRVLELDTRILVASLDTYLSRGQEVLGHATVNRPALRLVGSKVSSRPEPTPGRPAAPPAGRRRQRRRQVNVQPTAATPQTPRLRCENGCTFEWTKTDDGPPASMACPYRKRTRCGVVAA